MSTADTALSISIKMAPGPEHRQEPVAPDKIAENERAAAATVESVNTTTTGSSNNNNNHNNNDAAVATAAAIVIAEQNLNIEIAQANSATGADTTNQNSPPNNVDNKQEEPATLSALNEGELRALLDEAITYKCPKDREGKSSLFKELLQEAEADETEEGRRVISNSRCLPGSNRRRHKRESVSERLTHGGSLQNLAQPITSEFDSSFAYLTSGSCHTYGSSRRKNKKYTGPSVSARQREGGSLPSNVNASHSIASLANLDLIFDKKKGFCEERPTYDWTNKEKSKSLDKPSYTSTKKEDKEKEKKDSKREVVSSGETEPEAREKRVSKGKYGTNDVLDSDNPPPEYKSDYMVIDLGDVEVGAISERSVGSTASGIQRPRSLDTETDEGTELKIIEPRRPVQYITRATFDITQTPVDTTIEFPIREHKQEKSKISVNGTEVTGALSFQPHNSVKCGIASNSSSTSQGKVVPGLCSVMPGTWQPQGITMEGPRFAAQHIAMKESSASGEKKSLDENGNSVQTYNGERKKPRRKHTQEHNVKVYNSENVEGHRHDNDIESLINFIENKESKGKKGKTTNSVRAKTNPGTKPRTREKDTKREELSTKLKSNSLEEISKTKLEDLTTEKSASSSGASSISSQQGINVALRRTKQKSTGDATADNSRGDRRSWGTEEGQAIYCNDMGEDYTNRRNLNKKTNPEPEHDTEFLVVTKKKKSKKQRRSSSGSRAQNLTTSSSYLQNSRGFSNDYRPPLSPELIEIRKSASSMPPSDKSADSSDLDSVHSLPVTSNSTKHNLTKVATSSGRKPQASYAEIARMASVMSHNSVLIPNMRNLMTASSWPSVPSKAPAESVKGPHDYYPSLDEIQHSERKVRQHQNSAHPNHAASLNLSLNKLAQQTNTAKAKSSSDEKKAVEAQDEALNKNLQVIKYVQDLKKMRENQDQQEQKHPASCSSRAHSNDGVMPNFLNLLTPKLNNTSVHPCNLTDSDNSANGTVNNNSSIPARGNSCRPRRTYVHNNQNTQAQGSYDEQHAKKATCNHDEAVKKSHNDATQAEGRSNNSTAVSHEDADAQQTRTTARPTQELLDEASGYDDMARPISDTRQPTAKAVKEYQNTAMKQDVAKTAAVSQSQNSRQREESNTENRRRESRRESQSTATQADREQLQRQPQRQLEVNSEPLPPVILLNETPSEAAKDAKLKEILTFGFEINKKLLSELQSDNEIETEANAKEEAEAKAKVGEEEEEEEEITPTPSPSYSPTLEPLVNDPNYTERNPPLPPLMMTQIRYDRFPSNCHMPQPSNSHMPPPPPPLHPVMMMPMQYRYPARFHPPSGSYLPPPPPPPPQPGMILEKFHQPREDFSMLYVAPEEQPNVQMYNHDKIVTFVGSAWDAVMREIPITSSGRIQFYSGQ